MIQSIFKTILIMSVTGGVISLIILAVCPFTEKAFSAAWNYYSRLLVILFLLVPVGLVGLNLQKVPFSDTKVDNVNDSKFTILLHSSNQVEKQVASKDALFTFAPYIWLLGMVACMGYKGTLLINFNRRLQKTNLPVEDEQLSAIFQECKVKMGINQTIDLYSNDRIKTPLLTGFPRAYLVLPEVEMNERELRLIFRHELIHFKRKDLLFKLAALLASTLHWFNPLVYKLIIDINYYCEISCDEQVVRDMSIEERRFYGKTILNILNRVISKQRGFCTTLCGTKKDMERRLTYMMNVKKLPKSLSVISLALLMILGAGGMGTSYIAQAAVNEPDVSRDQTQTPIVYSGEKELSMDTCKIKFNEIKDSDVKYVEVSDVEIAEDEDGSKLAKISFGKEIDAGNRKDSLQKTTYSYIDKQGNSVGLQDNESKYLYVGYYWEEKDTSTYKTAAKDVNLDGNLVKLVFTSDTSLYADNQAINNFIKNIVSNNTKNGSTEDEEYTKNLLENDLLIISDIEAKNDWPVSIEGKKLSDIEVKDISDEAMTIQF